MIMMRGMPKTAKQSRRKTKIIRDEKIIRTTDHAGDEAGIRAGNSL